MKEKIENPYVNAYGYSNNHSSRSQEGITLRDELAKTAMLGLISNFKGDVSENYEVISIVAYNMADEMLKERMKYNLKE